MKRKIISFVCIFAILISSIYIAFVYVVPKIKRTQEYNRISEMILDEDINSRTEEKIKAEYKNQYPDIDFPNGMLLKYYPLYAENQDFRGWISIPEFNLDLPIVQGKDNSYYLKKDFTKKYSEWGTSFFDCDNQFNPNDKNLIVFGHNSRYTYNEMFIPLNNYKTIDGYKKAPIIKCDTIYEEAQWLVYSVCIVDVDKKDSKNNFNYIVRNFSADDTFLDYMVLIKEKALYDTGIHINKDDEILTLSTCNYTFKNARLVIICRKVREGENLEYIKSQLNK